MRILRTASRIFAPPAYLRRRWPRTPPAKTPRSGTSFFALGAFLTAALLASGPAAAAALAAPGGGGGGWNTLISMLQGIVAIAGGIGLLVGILVIATAGASTSARQLGGTIIGGAAGGLLVAFLAVDIADWITQWI